MSSEEEEEEEEEEAGDVFDMEASMALPEVRRRSPNRSLASMRGSQSAVGTSATQLPVSATQPLLPPRNSARRGSVVQVGGRATSLSQSAELAVTLRRLKAASETGDPNVMQAALTAAGAVFRISCWRCRLPCSLPTDGGRLTATVSGQERQQ